MNGGNSAQEGRLLDEILALTLRMFYDAKYVVFVEAMTKLQRVRDVDLCGYLKFGTTKELNKIAEKLRQDGLLSIDVVSEVREVDEKTIQATYYSLDYKKFIDVCKYRMYCIQKQITDSASQDLAGPGYICSNPECGKVFNTIDAPMLGFTCDECSSSITSKKSGSSSLVDTTDASDNATDTSSSNNTLVTASQSNSVSHQMQKKFNEQTLRLRQLLKKTEDFAVQRSHYYRRKITTDALRLRESKEDGRETTVQVRSTRPTDGSSSSSIKDISHVSNEKPDTRVNVVIHKDMKELARRREAEIEDKKRQNAKPDWITHSTVSGEKISDQDAQSNNSAAVMTKRKISESGHPDQMSILKELQIQKDKKLKLIDQVDDQVEEEAKDTRITVESVKMEAKVEEFEEDDEDLEDFVNPS